VAWFRCLIRGEQFPGRIIGDDRPVGFYVTRFVEAASLADAEYAVVQKLTLEPKLAGIALPLSSAGARVEIEEIAEVRRDEVPPVQPGFAWHPM
jgi:hypothetical protein